MTPSFRFNHFPTRPSALAFNLKLAYCPSRPAAAQDAANPMIQTSVGADTTGPDPRPQASVYNSIAASNIVVNNVYPLTSFAAGFATGFATGLFSASWFEFGGHRGTETTSSAGTTQHGLPLREAELEQSRNLGLSSTRFLLTAFGAVRQARYTRTDPSKPSRTLASIHPTQNAWTLGTFSRGHSSRRPTSSIHIPASQSDDTDPPVLFEPSTFDLRLFNIRASSPASNSMSGDRGAWRQGDSDEAGAVPRRARLTFFYLTTSARSFNTGLRYELEAARGRRRLERGSGQAEAREEEEESGRARARGLGEARRHGGNLLRGGRNFDLSQFALGVLAQV
ncbi:hypothetical protein FA13DRAFT_1714628 [Coprinellus micaceus]|uniref:Uncharacterized protein n=1 Tax=Coprinellus micaceus TaxID=71717 RepID=A0A4Y7SRH0_COPMI|nr:hypothetical protein FA13DRAFT_1714628 [Coprinellus micaceus]